MGLGQRPRIWPQWGCRNLESIYKQTGGQNELTNPKNHKNDMQHAQVMLNPNMGLDRRPLIWPVASDLASFVPKIARGHYISTK